MDDRRSQSSPEELYIGTSLASRPVLCGHRKCGAAIGFRIFSSFEEPVLNNTGIKAALRRFVAESPDIYRLMNYAQFIKSASEALPSHQELIELNRRLFSQFFQVFDTAMADGSIRSDLKMPLGVFSIFFLITGFMGRVTEAGGVYAERYGIDADELVQYTFDMIDDLLIAR